MDCMVGREDEREVDADKWPHSASSHVLKRNMGTGDNCLDGLCDLQFGRSRDITVHELADASPADVDAHPANDQRDCHATDRVQQPVPEQCAADPDQGDDARKGIAAVMPRVGQEHLTILLPGDVYCGMVQELFHRDRRNDNAKRRGMHNHLVHNGISTRHSGYHPRNLLARMPRDPPGASDE